MMGLPAQYLLCKAMGDVLHSYTFNCVFDVNISQLVFSRKIAT